MTSASSVVRAQERFDLRGNVGSWAILRIRDGLAKAPAIVVVDDVAPEVALAAARPPIYRAGTRAVFTPAAAALVCSTAGTDAAADHASAMASSERHRRRRTRRTARRVTTRRTPQDEVEVEVTDEVAAWHHRRRRGGGDDA